MTRYFSRLQDEVARNPVDFSTANKGNLELKRLNTTLQSALNKDARHEENWKVVVRSPRKQTSPLESDTNEREDVRTL